MTLIRTGRSARPATTGRRQGLPRLCALALAGALLGLPLAGQALTTRYVFASGSDGNWGDVLAWDAATQPLLSSGFLQSGSLSADIVGTASCGWPLVACGGTLRIADASNAALQVQANSLSLTGGVRLDRNAWLTVATTLNVGWLDLRGGNLYLWGAGSPQVVHADSTLAGGNLISYGQGVTLDLYGDTAVTANTQVGAGWAGDGHYGTAINHASFSVASDATLSLYNQYTLDNLAGSSIVLAPNANLVSTGVVIDAGLQRVINRAGATLRMSGGIGLDQVRVRLDNAGLVQVTDNGTLLLAGGGVHDGGTFDGSGGTLLLGGQNEVRSTVTLIGGTQLNGSGSALNVAAGATLARSGHGYANLVTGTTLLNQGTVSSQVMVSGGLWDNRGRYEDDSQAMSTISSLGGRIDNSGTMSIRGQLALYGGSLDNSNLVSVYGNLWGPGTFNNSGRLELKPSGQLYLSGTVNNSGAMALQGSTGAAGTWTNRGWVQLDGTMDHGGQFYNQAGGTLVVNGSWTGNATVTNAGQITIASSARMALASLTQTDGLLTVDGQLDTWGGSVSLQGGALNGNGQINGDLFVGGGSGLASFRPGHSPGQMTISGSFSLLAGGELELQIERLANGQLAWDHVSAASMQLDGTLRFELGSGVSLADVSGLSFLDCGNGCSYGSGFSWTLVSADGQTQDSALFTMDSNGIGLSGPAAAVPEPASALLMMIGLGLGAGCVTFRRARPAGLR
jgi:hypothetical protein